MTADGPPKGRYGHVKISRKAYETDPFWNEPREFSRWEAWEYMIQAAGFKPTQWTAGGPVVRLARGETPPLSLSYLCRAWRWSTKKVRVFIDLLISEERIRKGQDTPQGHTYLLVNYDTYQGSGAQRGHSEGRAGAQLGQESEAVKQGSITTTPNKKRARALPDDWTPNDGHQEIATEEGRELVREVEKFRDWANSKGETRKDWDATFRNWLRSEYGKPRGGKHGRTDKADDSTTPQSYEYGDGTTEWDGRWTA